MKGSPAIGTRLLNGLELKHQSRFGLDCLNDHSIAEDLSRLLVERTSRGVEAFNCTRTWVESSPLRRWRDSMDNLKVLEKVAPRHDSATGLVVVLRHNSEKHTQSELTNIIASRRFKVEL